MEHGPYIGYIILFLGSCIEGESIVLFFSSLSYKGYLSFPVVLLVAFTGTLVADQTLFYVGRHYGPRLLKRNPQWKEKTDRVFVLLHKYNIWFILSFRFIYGIRTLSPVVIGASGVAIKRFTILNVIAAVIWTLISCTAGYMLGYFFADAIEEFIEKAIKYQKIFILSLVALIGAALLLRKGYQYRKKNQDKKNMPENDEKGLTP